MGPGWAGANWCRSSPTMSCATTRNRGWSRSWGSARPPERERPHTRTSRLGRQPVPEVRARPRSAARGCRRCPRCG
eukprot:9285609-Alexandrium_andersonii.AAC.1